MERRNNTGTVTAWICRDWKGCHIFDNRPTLIEDGDEWYNEYNAERSTLNDVINIKNMVYDLTYEWDVTHEPQKVTIKFEII